MQVTSLWISEGKASASSRGYTRSPVKSPHRHSALYFCVRSTLLLDDIQYSSRYPPSCRSLATSHPHAQHTHTHTLPAHLTIHACPSSFARFLLPLLQLDNCSSPQPLCCVAFFETPRIEKQHRACQARFSPLPRYFLRLARSITRTRSAALGIVCPHLGPPHHSKTRS